MIRAVSFCVCFYLATATVALAESPAPPAPQPGAEAAARQWQSLSPEQQKKLDAEIAELSKGK